MNFSSKVTPKAKALKRRIVWVLWMMIVSAVIGSVHAQYRPVNVAPPHMCHRISHADEKGTPDVTFAANPQPSTVPGKGVTFQCEVHRPFTQGLPTSIYILSPHGYKLCPDEDVRTGICHFKVEHIKPGQSSGMSFCVVSFGKQKTCILATAVDRNTATFPHVTLLSNKYALTTAGRPYKAKCQAIGFPKPQIHWRKGPFDVVDDPDHHVINPDNDSTDLVIKSLGVQHEGIYECYASNVLGTSYSNKIRIKLNAAPPLFTEQPVNRTVSLGNKAVLTCKAVGYPLPIISWLQNGTKAFYSSQGVVKNRAKGSQVLSHLILDTVTPDKLGEYKCIAVNGRGRIESDESYVTAGVTAEMKAPEKPKTLYLDLVIALGALGILATAAAFWVFKVIV